MFIKNTLRLVTGTLIAQLLPLFVLPFLTREMGADNFGVFSLFFTSTVMLGTLSAFRFDYAINAAKNPKDAKLILILCFLLNLCLLIPLLLVVCFSIYMDWLGWVWLLLPFSAIGLSINQSYCLYANFRADFTAMSRSRILYASVCALIQFSLVYWAAYHDGAFWGILVGYVISTLYLYLCIPVSLCGVSYLRLRVIFRRYIAYPKLVFPGTLVNFLSGNLPIYLIGYLFGAAQSGYYSLAVRVAGVPTVMLGRSIGEVFRKTAYDNYKKDGHFYQVFKKVALVSFLISLAGFLLLYFISEPLFEFVFGEGWDAAALYVQLLIPMFILQFTTAPIAYSLMLVGWQKQELYWQVFRLVLVVLALLAAYMYSLSLIHI